MGLLTVDSRQAHRRAHQRPVGRPQDARRQPGTDGFAQRLEASSRATSAAARHDHLAHVAERRVADALQTQMTNEDTRLAARETRLKAQFAAMEPRSPPPRPSSRWLTARSQAVDREHSRRAGSTPAGMPNTGDAMSVSTHARAAAYQQSSVLTAPPASSSSCSTTAPAGSSSRRRRPCARATVRVAHQRLRRAEDIITELLATLNHEQGGEVASRLRPLHLLPRRARPRPRRAGRRQGRLHPHPAR